MLQEYACIQSMCGFQLRMGGCCLHSLFNSSAWLPHYFLLGYRLLLQIKKHLGEHQLALVEAAPFASLPLKLPLKGRDLGEAAQLRRKSKHANNI